jgi:hypothetical protein
MRDLQFFEGSGVEYDQYANFPSTVPDPVNFPNLRFITARDMGQLRDDGAPRPTQLQEKVAVGASRQIRVMKKMITTAANLSPAQNTGWDINLDGLKHIGLYPDFFQDARNVGVTWEQLTPLFNATEDYVSMWERGCSTANAFRVKNNVPGTVCQ